MKSSTIKLIESLNESNLPQLHHGSQRLYDAMSSLDIPENDKVVLADALASRFGRGITSSTVPPFILSALGEPLKTNGYPTKGSVKWFIKRPKAIELYYNKYKGTDKLPGTGMNNTQDNSVEDATIKNTEIIKELKFNQGDWTLQDALDLINNSNKSIIATYGAFNKEHREISKEQAIKSLNHYGIACDIIEGNNYIDVTFYSESDLYN